MIQEINLLREHDAAAVNVRLKGGGGGGLARFRVGSTSPQGLEF